MDSVLVLIGFVALLLAPCFVAWKVDLERQDDPELEGLLPLDQD